MKIISTPNVRTIQEQQRLKLRVLRREIKKGLDAVRRGKLVSPAQAFAEFDKMLREPSTDKKRPKARASTRPGRTNVPDN